MIDRVIGNKLIPASVRHDIVERTDGIPLFVEEMTKSVLEAGSEEEAQTTAGFCAAYDFGSARELARISDGAARTGSAQPRKWLRSARLSGASSRMHSCLRWRGSRRMILAPP